MTDIRTETTHYTDQDLDGAFTTVGATLDQLSAYTWAVRKHWGDYGYRIRTNGCLAQVEHTDGSRFYLKADRFGNVTQLVPSDQ